MAHDTESFTALRDSLRDSLRMLSCIPKLDDKGFITEKVEQRFFPAGTAKIVLTHSKLRRLFKFVADAASSSRLQPEQLAQKASDERICNFLAILVFSKCDLEAFVSFTLKLVVPHSSIHHPPTLPIEDRSILASILNSQFAAEDFYEHQFAFFAPILEKHKEIKSSYRRLPYLQEKLIGQGSFGKIYKVTISPGHYRYDDLFTNDRKLVLARKDFVLDSKDKAHEKERDVIREIVGNAKKHDNIVENWGSLQIGSTYSLFMDLAECDLKQYMINNPNAPDSFEAKADLLHCAVGLAGAIAYLHEDLESSTFERLSCFHMDLKPQNILVVLDSKGKPQWKLSDFNMSRVKRLRTDEHFSLRRRGTFNQVLDINKLFKRTVPDASDPSTTDYTINRRGFGTYLAPEACVGDAVYAEGDTWSLGCVIVVVFSYLYGGQTAVTRFSDLRAKQGFDAFFTFANTRSQHKLSDARNSDAVGTWLQELRFKTAKRHAREGLIFDTMLGFLEKEVLIIDPTSRQQTTARDIKQKLLDACNKYRAVESTRVESPKTPKHRFRLSSVFSTKKQSTLTCDLHQSVWRLPPLSGSWRNCVFGPRGEPFVCVTDSSLVAYSLGHVLLTDEPNDLIKLGTVAPLDARRLWSGNVAASTQFIIAATDHESFDCYIYHIPQPDSATSKLELVAHWELELPRIRKVAISPDARYAAFVLNTDPVTGEDAPLHIVSLNWLQVAGNDQKLHSMVSSSSGSSSTASTPLGRPLSLPCPAEDVRDLSFSAVGGLYAVVKPTYVEPKQEYAMTVFSWHIESGRPLPLPRSKISHDGKDDLLHRLFTSFAPYNTSMAFAVISQEKRVISRAWDPKVFKQSRVQSCRLMKILMDNNDRNILAIGTKQANEELQLFTFPTSTTQEEFQPDGVASLPGMKYGSKFAAVFASQLTQSRERRYVLVSSIDDNAIRVIRTYLDAP